MSKAPLNEAQQVIQQLLDSDPDALDPRADLDRLIPYRCPDCGSSNISDEADDEGLIDCYNCGIWFDPLHSANSPAVPGNYPDPSTVEIIDYPVDAEGRRRPMESTDPDESVDDPDNPEKIFQHFVASTPERRPRISISFTETTPDSAASGDSSDYGWIDEEGVEMVPDAIDYEDGLGPAELAAKFLKNEGASAASSSSSFHPGVWYSTGYNTVDYTTGTERERNYHLVDFTPEEEQKIWNLLHPQRGWALR